MAGCARYNEVLFQTFWYCNVGGAEEYRSLYRALVIKEFVIYRGSIELFQNNLLINMATDERMNI